MGHEKPEGKIIFKQYPVLLRCSLNCFKVIKLFKKHFLKISCFHSKWYLFHSEHSEWSEDSHLPSHDLAFMLPILPQWNICQLVFENICLTFYRQHLLCQTIVFDFSLFTDFGIYIQQMDGEKNVPYFKNLFFCLPCFLISIFLRLLAAKIVLWHVGNVLHCFFEVCCFLVFFFNQNLFHLNLSLPFLGRVHWSGYLLNEMLNHRSDNKFILKKRFIITERLM